ncbi:MAG: YIP1 family protein [Ignavibacteriales bacterium]|nr:YIP1 family protein [Ignavibacteriales bacterium]
MKVDNRKILCSNCNAINHIEDLRCVSCGHYIREKIPNIDLWSIVWHLIESPGKAFQRIIQSEKKNFIILLTFLVMFKFFLNSLKLEHHLHSTSQPEQYFFSNFLVATVWLVVYLLVFSFIIHTSLMQYGTKLKFKSIYAILIYSMLPYAILLVVFAPIQYAVFGSFWFLLNPDPVVIQPHFTYLLLIIEFFGLFFSFILTYIGLSKFTSTKMIPLISSLLFHILLWAPLFFIGLYPF